jgi:hypothetical protein
VNFKKLGIWYLETTVVSYYTAWPSQNLIIAAHQHITHEWWHTRLSDFDIFISQFILDEAGQGDPEAVKERLKALESFKLLDVTEKALDIAKSIMGIKGFIPEKAATDAAHIGMAAAHGIHFLLTWNCKHLANAEMSDRVEEVCNHTGSVARSFARPKNC